MTPEVTTVDAIAARGYTRREAAFLVLVARHSGYFLRRQFSAGIGCGRGFAAAAFVDKLLRRKDATVQTFCGPTQVLHLAPRALYESAGVPSLPSRRRRRPAGAIAARLMALDFVLDHPSLQFLATEGERLAYIDRLGIDRLWLPQQRYLGHRATAPHVRYFVESGPMAVSVTDTGAETLVTSFIDEGPQASMSLATFLTRQEGLLQQVPAWRVVFVTESSCRAVSAQHTFDRWRARSAPPTPFASSALDAFDEYGRLHQAFERQQWSTLQKSGLDRLRDLRPLFQGADWERLYGQWEQRGTDAIAAARVTRLTSSQGAFEVCVLPHRYAATRPVGGPR